MTLNHGRLLTIAAILALLVPGVMGHDPWKQDEGYTFGIVMDILQTGHWVVPTLAGEPFMEKPPLFYLSAAGTARLLSPWLPLHDGARVAAALYIALGLLFTALAGRRMFGKGHGSAPALLAAGCVGLLPHAHELISDTSLFAGFAIAIYGFTYATQRPLRAGLVIGTGVGIGFMSKGLVEPAMLGLAAMALPCVSREWRSSAYAKALAWSAVFAAPWLLAWPAALYLESPREFYTWFWVNNFGRYFGFANLGADTEPWYYTHTLPWFTFPAGPLAAWTAFRAERLDPEPRRNVILLCTLVAAMCAVLATAATARALYAMPMLIPLALLASVAAPELPSRVGKALAAAGLTLGIAVGASACALWAYGTAHGHAPDVPFIVSRLPADYAFPFFPAFLGGAVVLCAVVFACARHRDASWLHRWTLGLALAWGIPMTLLLPWIDEARSFREPFAAMAMAARGTECIASLGLGENQRGMLSYVTSLRPAQWGRHQGCGFALWQRNGQDEEAPAIVDGWPLVWEGSRAGENGERFFLYRAPGIERAALRAQPGTAVD